MISVIFEDGISSAEGRRRVGDRLARVQAELPEDARPELGPDAPATGQIFWYTVEGGGLDLGRLRAIQDWYVRPQIASVPGVAEVASVGGFPIEYQIAPDLNRLGLYGLTTRDVVEALSRSNAAAAGHVIHKGNAEYVVRGVGWVGASSEPGDESFDSSRALADLENVAVVRPAGGTVRLGDVAEIGLGPGFRRGVLEKDGNEVTGGVVLLANGENPLEVTGRIKAKIRELQTGLPRGVRIVPFYDRTPLIEGAIGTVTRTVIEAIVSASLCVLLILLHVRTSLVIASTIPLAALSSFLIMAVLRRLSIVDVQANATSLAGIAISIGVLVDSSVVMAENVMHRLREQFGNRVVRGDVSAIVLQACLAVGRPIVFSVAIMVLSFLPVFALGGIEGKMFHPMAYTKTFALGAVAILAITLVPALCTIFIRGKLRSETDNPLIRGVIEVYRPVLSYLIDQPAALAWVLGVTFLLGFIPLGSRPLTVAILVVAMVATALLVRAWVWAVVLPMSLLTVALIADQSMKPLEREFMAPLDEGMVMDMPITVPRASVTESLDDLKARDMVLCRFPEVDMVVGKAGRAETPTDPAPLDMIETMVNFRPRELWPRRKLGVADALSQGHAVYDALVTRGVLGPPTTSAAEDELIEQSVSAAVVLFDAASREYAYHRYQEMLRETGGVSPSSSASVVTRGSAGSRAVAASRGAGRRRVDHAGRAALYAAGDGAASRPRANHRLRSRASSQRGGPSARGRNCGRYSPHAIAGRRWPSSWRGSAVCIAADPRTPPGAGRGSRYIVEAIQPAADALEGRSNIAGGLWRRARLGCFDAGMDERLDDADPESRRHACNRCEHADRHPRAGPKP